jgi:hypothetical protein
MRVFTKDQKASWQNAAFLSKLILLFKNRISVDHSTSYFRKNMSPRVCLPSKKIAVEMVPFFFDLDDEVVDVIKEVKLRTITDISYMSADAISIIS